MLFLTDYEYDALLQSYSDSEIFKYLDIKIVTTPVLSKNNFRFLALLIYYGNNLFVAKQELKESFMSSKKHNTDGEEENVNEDDYHECEMYFKKNNFIETDNNNIILKFITIDSIFICKKITDLIKEISKLLVEFKKNSLSLLYPDYYYLRKFILEIFKKFSKQILECIFVTNVHLKQTLLADEYVTSQTALDSLQKIFNQIQGLTKLIIDCHACIHVNQCLSFFLLGLEANLPNFNENISDKNKFVELIMMIGNIFQKNLNHLVKELQPDLSFSNLLWDSTSTVSNFPGSFLYHLPQSIATECNLDVEAINNEITQNDYTFKLL